MFAVKQEINNATSLFEIESITVGYPGSDQFKQAFEIAEAEVVNKNWPPS